MDSTILAAFVSVLVSGVISFSVFLFSQHYLVEKSRRRIIRVIFRKIKIKTSKGKGLDLLEVYRYIREVKVFERFIFFIVAWAVSPAIISHYGKSNLITTLNDIELSYVIIFAFLFMGLAFFSLVMKVKSPEESMLKYVFKKSFPTFSTDWVLGWVLFILYASLLITNERLYLYESVISLIVYTILISTLLVFIPLIGTIPMKYDYHDDLESAIFKDNSGDMTIKIYGASGTVHGKIVDIRDELTIQTSTNGDKGSIIYVPWESIQFFEIF